MKKLDNTVAVIPLLWDCREIINDLLDNMEWEGYSPNPEELEVLSRLNAILGD